MLLRHRSADIDTTPAVLSPGLTHLDQRAVAMLRWLGAVRLDFVLIGPVAHAVLGELTARGPVAVVPAPYRRNYERLAAALTAHDATLRSERPRRDPGAEVKLSAEALARGRRWLLSVGELELDVESSGAHAAATGAPDAAPAPIGDGTRYQELLYDATRIELAPGIAVEVAAPEDLELFSHLRRAGVAPEFRITRAAGRPAADRARGD